MKAHWVSSIADMREAGIGELKEASMEISQCEQQRKTGWGEQKDGSLRVLWNKNMRSTIHVTGVPEREDKVWG